MVHVLVSLLAVTAMVYGKTIPKQENLISSKSPEKICSTQDESWRCQGDFLLMFKCVSSQLKIIEIYSPRHCASRHQQQKRGQRKFAIKKHLL